MKYCVYGVGRAGRVHAKIYEISYSPDIEESYWYFSLGYWF